MASAGLEVEKDGNGESTCKPGYLVRLRKAFITLCVCKLG